MIYEYEYLGTKGCKVTVSKFRTCEIALKWLMRIYLDIKNILDRSPIYSPLTLTLTGSLK